MSEQSQPWDRAPGESPKAFASFCAYRDWGPTRSLAKLAAGGGPSLRMLQQWSAQWGWVARAAAWDSFHDQVRQSAILDEVEAMAARHAREAREAQDAAMGPVRAILEQLGTVEARRALASLPVDDAVSLALAAARHLPALQAAERLARGEPTSISEHVVTSELPADHLDTVLAALDRAGLHVTLPGGEDFGEDGGL